MNDTRNSALRVARNWALHHGRPENHLRLSSVSRNLRPGASDRELARFATAAKTGLVPVLVKLARKGDLATLRHFIASLHPVVVRAVVNARARVADDTMLEAASLRGHVDVVEYLLTLPGIDVNENIYTGGGSRSLQLAVFKGHEAVVRLLLAFPDIDLRGALYDAIVWNRVPVAKLLLDRGADVNERYMYPRVIPLFATIGRYQSHQLRFNEPAAKLLINRGADVNARDSEGETPLIKACKERNLAAVRFLLTVPGIDVDAKNNKGTNALTFASRRGQTAIVAMLKDFKQQHRLKKRKRS